MRELDLIKDTLIALCTPGGRDALTLETSQLHDLCASSEREMRERLAVCESRLADMDSKLAGRAQDFRAQAEDLLNELHAQKCYLEFGEGRRTISQLQENWHNFKVLKIVIRVCSLRTGVTHALYIIVFFCSNTPSST